MDLIYIILSIYLRLFQTALPLSRSAARSSRLGPGPGSPWAVWLPVVGWVSVMVRFVPQARWLAWRVTAVERWLGDPPARPQPPRSGRDHQSDNQADQSAFVSDSKASR